MSANSTTSSLVARLEAKKKALEGQLKTEPETTPYGELIKKGFTEEDITELHKTELTSEALSGHVTPGMMHAHTKTRPAVDATGAKGCCETCKGAKYMPAKALGKAGNGFLQCPDCAGSGVHVAKTGQIIPPDAPTRDLRVGDVGTNDEIYNGPVKTEPRPETTQEKPKRHRRTKAEMQADADADAQERVQATVERVAALGEPGPDRIREIMTPVAEKIIEAFEAPTPGETLKELETHMTSALDKLSTESVPKKVHSHIYINCRPDNTSCVDGLHWAQTIKSEVEKQLNVSDYRLVDYAKGKAKVIAAVRQAMQHNLPESVYIDSKTNGDMAQIFLEALTSIPTDRLSIVRGF